MVVRRRHHLFSVDTPQYYLGTANYIIYPSLYPPCTYDLEYASLHSTPHDLECFGLYSPSRDLHDHNLHDHDLFDYLFNHLFDHLFDHPHFLDKL